MEWVEEKEIIRIKVKEASTGLFDNIQEEDFPSWLAPSISCTQPFFVQLRVFMMSVGILNLSVNGRGPVGQFISRDNTMLCHQMWWKARCGRTFNTGKDFFVLAFTLIFMGFCANKFRYRCYIHFYIWLTPYYIKYTNSIYYMVALFLDNILNCCHSLST